MKNLIVAIVVAVALLLSGAVFFVGEGTYYILPNADHHRQSFIDQGTAVGSSSTYRTVQPPALRNGVGQQSFQGRELPARRCVRSEPPRKRRLQRLNPRFA